MMTDQEQPITVKGQLESKHTSENSPFPRMNALAIVYKSKVYISGGYTNSQNYSPNRLLLNYYCFDKKKWNKITTFTSSEDFEMFEPQCGVLINTRWYQFGNITKAGAVQSSLWKYSLDQMSWTSIEQKGDIPIAEGGCIVGYDRNWLVFYGGYNSDQIPSVNNLYVFSIDSRTWYHCSGNYDFKLKSRQGTAMCTHDGRIYLFGGAYDGSNGIDYLNDFYEITIAFPFKGSPARAEVQQVITIIGPEPRAQHFLFSIDKNSLCLIGGNDNQQIVSNMWTFNLSNQRWSKVADLLFDPFNRLGYSCVKEADSFHLFGGLKINKKAGEQTHELMNDLWSLKVERPNSTSNFSAEDDKHCKLCFQNRNDFVQSNLKFSSQWVDSLVEMIQYPFAAIGLLVDNCLILGATTVNICIDGPPTNYVIKIQDNGKDAWTEEEFIANLCYFQSQNNIILIGCDKKTKRVIGKQNSRREFGSNLKMGSLRWGSYFLYISCSGEQVRVCLCYKQQESEANSQNYTVHYYSFHSVTKALINEDRSGSRNFIEQSYGKYIKEALARKKISNTLYIFDTILNKPEENIRLTEDNDILLGSEEDLQKLQKLGYSIHESIDISLKTYLSYLYLKNDNLNLSLGVKNQPNLIFIQGTLEKVDRLCRSKSVVDLESIIDFDFKLAEFFYLRQIKKQNQFFSNGLLLYSKNRLIKRYKPKLGSIIINILTQTSGYFNYLPLFGFAELPQSVPVNAFKTDFVFSAMTDKLYSRIKFVDESVKARSLLWGPPIKNYSHYQRVKELKEATERQDVIKKRSNMFKLTENSMSIALSKLQSPPKNNTIEEQKVAEFQQNQDDDDLIIRIDPQDRFSPKKEKVQQHNSFSRQNKSDL